MARGLQYAFLLAVLAALPSGARAQDSDIQQKLSNPIASLTLVPIQANYDVNIGPRQDGTRITTNVQPVTPFKLDSEWSLVVRTIVPIISQRGVFPGAGEQFGLGDTLQSFFLCRRPSVASHGEPGQPCSGARELINFSPMANGRWDRPLQAGPWTVGVLSNHVWSFAGDQDRPDVSSSFIQPFILCSQRRLDLHVKHPVQLRLDCRAVVCARQFPDSEADKR